MKRLFLIAIALTLLCAACAPTSGESSPTPAVTPALEWDRSSGARLVRVTFCCGLISETEARAYLPEAQIWGDGRVIWVERTATGARRPLVGMLSEAQLAALLVRFEAGGFFEWEELYTAENPPTDYPHKCIEVDLAERNHQVCELYGGAPPAFGQLFDLLAGGAGAAGRDYVPERGYLSGFRLEPGAGLPLEQPALDWEQLGTGLAPDLAAAGAWIEGQALETLWAASHTTPYHLPVVAGEEDTYRLAVQVTEVSWIEPPEPPEPPERDDQTSSPVETQPAQSGLGEPLPGLLLQFEIRPTFWFPEALQPFGRVPEFTLFEDGRLFYIEEDIQGEVHTRTLMQAQLSTQEAGDLVDQVLALGFERLESHPGSCPPPDFEDQSCLADGVQRIYRLKLTSGELREVVIYEHFANDQEVHDALIAFLAGYSHPQAEPYRPERAALFIEPLEELPDSQPADWPFDPAWLEPPQTNAWQWARPLSGTELDQVMETLDVNMGHFAFRHTGQLYRVVLVPWLPGVDYTDEVLSYP